MTLLSDNRQLLDSFRAGDPAAMSQVYRFYSQQVVRFLSGGFLVESGGQTFHFQGYRNSFDLQNAVQESFVRAFAEGARMRYDGLRPYGPYLLTIARNVVVDELRAARSKLAHFAPEEADEAELSASVTEGHEHLEPPDSYPLHKELTGLVQTFLASLSERERTLVEQRFHNGLSQRDAADALGLSRMQVRTLEEKVRKKALDHFRGTGYLEDILVRKGLLGLLALAWGVAA